MVALLAGMCSLGYAQDYLNPPKTGEILIGTVKVYARQGHKGHEHSKWYSMLLEEASNKYPGKIIDIREIITREQGCTGCDWYYGPATGKVVDLLPNFLYQALNKALRKVSEGSRMAIDLITVTSDMDRENLKDQLIDVLLEKGYRVVAKEYLQKLYEEQKDQECGLYNPDTKVEGSNFSAVGYFINVKVTESSIRVQVVNVSTGEYEGNATVSKIN